MSEVKRYWIYKGTSNFCEELIPDDNCENMVKQKPDGFYDIVSTADTIEGGVEVVLASDYEKLKAQLERAEAVIEHYKSYCVPQWVEVPGMNGMRGVQEIWLAREYFKEKEQK